MAFQNQPSYIHCKTIYLQRWRLLLTISLVNIFYIISGFLLNFKELSRFLYNCCLMQSPLEGSQNSLYTVKIVSISPKESLYC